MPKFTRGKSNKKKMGHPKSRKGAGAYYPGGIVQGQRVLRGKGNFWDDLRGIAKPVLGALGGGLDVFFPGAGSIARGVAKLIGAGAYVPVKSNAILANPVPKVGSMQDEGIRYSHQEFLGDVTGSEAWELTQFHVNPGLPEVFPWLAGIASNFQKFRIDGLVFYLRSTSSVAIANTSNLGLGTVLGGYQYNVYDPAPNGKPDFLALSGSVSGKPSEDHIYPMECDRSKNVFGNLLIRTGGVQDDQAKYDHAVFNLATVGFPGTYYLGELWVSYNIVLMAPKVESNSQFLTSLTAPFTLLTGSDTFVPDACLEDVSGSPEHGLSLVPTVTDASKIAQSMGWTTQPSTLLASEAGSHPQDFIVPPGTSGHFYVECKMTGGDAGSVDELRITCQDGTGSLVTVNESPAGGQVYGRYGVSDGTNGCWGEIVKLDALPDRPMRINITHTDVSWADAKYSIFIQKLPERLFAGPATGAVSLAQKVQRLHGAVPSAATQSAVSALGHAARSAPAIQRTASVVGLADTVPLRVAAPSPEVQATSSVLVSHPASAAT